MIIFAKFLFAILLPSSASNPTICVASPAYGQPGYINREHHDRNAARRGRVRNSAEQELLDRQQHQLCASETPSLALSI